MGNPKVGAVVISYKPSPELLRNVILLTEQVGHVLVVDNTPVSEKCQILIDIERLEGCTVICNQENLGLGAALNKGVQRAVEMGFAWILTSDQDSSICAGYVEAMLSTYFQQDENFRIGVLCPRYIDAGLNIEIPKLRAANGEILGCMTSGAMFEAKTFAMAGPMDELLFIDYVDLEYCLRVRALGLRVIESPHATLLHSLGRITMHPLFGIVTNHSPKRRYYINRNRLVLVKRYFLKDPEWALNKLKTLVLDTIMVLLVEDEKLAKARYMARAFYDGMLNRLGQRVPL